MDDGPDGLLDEVNDLAHSRHELRAGNDQLAGTDGGGIRRLVEEGPYEAGLVLSIALRSA